MKRLSVVKGDITTFVGDAIVNAANSALSGGGGVDGAIHRAAGPELVKKCRTLGRCPAGQAVLTAGYNLPADYVIHAVGPAWDGGNKNEADLLESCYSKSMEIAIAENFRSLAFPAISCGVYKFPIPKAAQIATETVSKYIEKSESDITVTFFCFDDKTFRAFTKYAKLISDI